MIKKISSISIKVALIVVGILGIILTANSTGFMGQSNVFQYFTVQSNVTIISAAFIFLVNEISPKKFVNQVFHLVKFAFTIAITITFIVFFTMLAPLVGIDYLLSFNNFSLHAIVPILAIADFFIFDKDINLTYPNSMFGLGMPLYYLIYFTIGAFFGATYNGNGDVAPYFFLNYKQNGFFFEKGTLGVIPWCLILMIAMAGLCLLFALLMRLRQGKMKK